MDWTGPYQRIVKLPVKQSDVRGGEVGGESREEGSDHENKTDST